MSSRSKEHSQTLFTRIAGVTMVELVVTLAVIAISLTLAIPAWLDFKEKRNMRKAAETIMSFVNLAQSSAIKLNEEVTIAWAATGSNHSQNFCIGASAAPQNTPCDCWENDDTDADF